MNQMMNESVERDLKHYKKTTLWSSALLFGILISLVGLAWAFGYSTLISPLMGSLMGTFFSTVNLFALGYAFDAIVVKKMARWAILWPLSTFLVMALLGFLLAAYGPDYILGFALGLTAPVLFGAVIVFGSHKPA
jgi:hypothetical protein